jgi:hypothetical protein
MRWSKRNKNVLEGFEFYYLENWQEISYRNKFVTLEKGKLVIRKDYAWDGASGPVFQTKTLVAASLLHDALYQIIRELKLSEWFRKEADNELRDEYLRLCVKVYPSKSLKDKARRQLARTRAVYIYQAVRKFGRAAINKHKPKKIYEV